MLMSEVMGWHFIISWDNASPADSKKLLKELAKLGKVTTIATKTSVALAPKAGVDHFKVRRVIMRNLNPRIGNAFYVNLRTGRTLHISKATKGIWKYVVK